MSIMAAIGGIGGSLLQGLFGNSAANKQAKLQKQFAKQGIQWRVADAKAAGVHPLAALGAQTHSYAPVQVGTPDFASAGQALGRAIDVNMDESQRTAQRLTLENQALQNDLIRTQIAGARVALNRAMLPPARPSASVDYALDGQGNVVTLPRHRISAPQQTTHLATPVGTILRRPGTSDAQTWEDAYGEHVGGVLGGIVNFPSDLLYTGDQAILRNFPNLYQWFQRNYGWR